MLTRRRFVGNTAKLSAGLALGSYAKAWSERAGVCRLRMGRGAPVALPHDFTGLGYEMSSVASTGLLSPTNRRYVELIKCLGPAGVLRVGGIVANYTRYEAHGMAVAEKQNTVITRTNLEQFAGLLRETGWRAIWSVNFAQGSVDDAVNEARAVRDVLGSRLLAMELGNEVDTYNRGQPFRPASYDYAAFRKEYGEWHAKLVKALPGLPFAAPDTASAYDWVEKMAMDATGDVQLLTTHYYRNGQRQGSAEQLLHADPRLRDTLLRLREASKRSGLAWRMCEGNSFSGGGLPGVSDTVIGALWTLDFMLLLAKYQCSGVNVETGVNQLGFVSSYSPIQDDGKGQNSAGVPYYGMLAFAQAAAGCSEVLPAELDCENANVTAYVLGSSGRARSVVIINKETAQGVDVSLADVGGAGRMQMLRMREAAAEGQHGMTLGGSAVDDAGRWRAAEVETVRDARVLVPAMSALILRAARV